MTFAEEARSRRAHLLRMANTQDGRLRDRLAAYADETPEPPAIGHHGIETTGCPRCQATMWRQRNDFVCAGCGHVKGAVMECPHCHVEMKPPPSGWVDRHHCPKCKRTAASTDSPEDIEARWQQRLEAIDLLDAEIERLRQENKVINEFEQDINGSP
ncbi:RNHCP domain-containing protein [Streptomyces violascens]|uniref:RNHCP domain-containing protein n=1 Tax=Streptomyces violascens TaxID=67381 RepID=UPI0036B5D9D6